MSEQDGMRDPFSGSERGSSEPPKPNDPSLQDRSSDVADDRNSTTIIGANGAGKTFLLAAFYRACALSGGNGFQLTFVPEATPNQASGTSELIQKGIQHIIENTDNDEDEIKASTFTSEYRFRLECRAAMLREPNWLMQPQTAAMTVLDGPGGSLFPRSPNKIVTEQARAAMFDGVRSCHNLVICVNSSDPELTLFQREFPMIVAGAARRPNGKLGVTRVLLLFTQIDGPAKNAKTTARRKLAGLPPSLRPTAALRIMADNRITEQQLVEKIDPLGFARTALDQSSISMIRRSLDAKAKMAIGVCSSTGFYADGSSFWDTQRSKPKQMETFDADERSRQWRPYGIEEAMLFLLTGRASNSLRLYTADADRVASTSRIMRLLPLVRPTY